MYISEKKFIAMCQEQQIANEDLYTYVHVALSLRKKYGTGVYASSLFSRIYEVDESFAEFLLLLRRAEKASVPSLRKMISLLDVSHKKQSSGIHVASQNATLTDAQKRILGGEVTLEQENLHELGLMVQESGKIYKRTLQRDVQKLLS